MAIMLSRRRACQNVIILLAGNVLLLQIYSVG